MGGDQLLISCLAGVGMGGGLFLHDGRRVERLDAMPTSGLAYDGRRLARCLDSSCQDRDAETSRLLIYDESGVVHHHRLDGVTSPHGIHASGGEVAVVATTQNRLVWFGEDGRELRRWQAPGQDESWHLNDVVEAGSRLYVCAFGRSDRSYGWKEQDEPTGCIVAIDTCAEVVGGLDRPHSPRLVDGCWLVCNSATGELLAVDPATGRVARRRHVGSWPRGLALDERRIYVGLSPPRGRSKALPGSVCVLDRATWQPVTRFSVPAAEVFDLLLVPPEIAAGVRRGLRAGPRRRARRRHLRIVQTYEPSGFGDAERTVEALTGRWLDDGHQVWTWLPGSADAHPRLPGVVSNTYSRAPSPDIVVVHGGRHGAAYAGLAEDLTGTPVVEVVHRRVRALSGASAYVAVSRAAAAVQELDCQVLPPGVGLPPLRATRESARTALGIGPADLVVARHAEVETEKGWHWTMQTMQRLWANGLDVRLLVVGAGHGPAAAVLAAWAERQPGVVRSACDPPTDLLVAADLYLETSPAEAFGLAVAEAALLGLPVVAFRAPGVAETLGRSYPMVPVGDIAAAAAAVAELAGNARARATLGGRLRRRVATQFDPALCARRYIALFETLLASRSDRHC